MIQHELLLWKTANKFSRHRKVTGINKDVVGKIMTSQSAYPPLKVIANHEAVVGLRLDDVPESSQLRITGETFKPVVDIGVEQVHPPHYSSNHRLFFRQIEQEFRLLL